MLRKLFQTPEGPRPLLPDAAFWKRLSTNFACPIVSLPSSLLTRPFLSMCIASTPSIALSAVWNERKVCIARVLPSASFSQVKFFGKTLRIFKWLGFDHLSPSSFKQHGGAGFQRFAPAINSANSRTRGASSARRYPPASMLTCESVTSMA